MTNKVYQSQKRTLRYSKKRIEKAGRDIRHGCTGDLRAESIAIIQNFREIHLYPLMLIKNHLSLAAKKVDKKVIVARRLKRLATIIDKLERPTLDGTSENSINLTRMQDIGGCRAVVKNLKQLNALYERLRNSRSMHSIVHTSNYLTPKESGYGGIHLVYSCFDGFEHENEWSKTKIEVQLRTELQHAWATSLEIIDTLEGFELKTTLKGHDEWRRFFKISGLLVANKEKSCVLDSNEVTNLSRELKQLEATLRVTTKLAHYNLIINITTSQKNIPRRILRHQGLYLITLSKKDVEEKEGKLIFTVSIETYAPKQADKAFEMLSKYEADRNISIAVLVDAGDVRSLKKAYPNYFGSTVVFRQFLTETIDSVTEK